MEKWQTLIDKQIQEATQKGQLANLPGEGKPLTFDDNSHTPPELRMMHKILKDNNLAPDWMMEGKALDDLRDKFLARLRNSYKVYHTAQNADDLTRSRASTVWQNAQSRYREEANKLNKEINSHNLKLPAGLAHKTPINIERELQRLMA